jgi:hypothetical protein
MIVTPVVQKDTHSLSQGVSEPKKKTDQDPEMLNGELTVSRYSPLLVE